MGRRRKLCQWQHLLYMKRQQWPVLWCFLLTPLQYFSLTCQYARQIPSCICTLHYLTCHAASLNNCNYHQITNRRLPLVLYINKFGITVGSVEVNLCILMILSSVSFFQLIPKRLWKTWIVVWMQWGMMWAIKPRLHLLDLDKCLLFSRKARIELELQFVLTGVNLPLKHHICSF